MQKGALKSHLAQGALIPESVQLFEVKFSDLPVVVAFNASFLWVFYPPAPQATPVYKHNWIKMPKFLHSCSLRKRSVGLTTSCCDTWSAFIVHHY